MQSHRSTTRALQAEATPKSSNFPQKSSDYRSLRYHCTQNHTTPIPTSISNKSTAIASRATRTVTRVARSTARRGDRLDPISIDACTRRPSIRDTVYGIRYTLYRLWAGWFRESLDKARCSPELARAVRAPLAPIRAPFAVPRPARRTENIHGRRSCHREACAVFYPFAAESAPRPGRSLHSQAVLEACPAKERSLLLPPRRR